jgi:hypothetical protein
VTHTGALDIKDVLGYARLVLTTPRYDALDGAFPRKTEKGGRVPWMRATSSSRR